MPDYLITAPSPWQLSVMRTPVALPPSSNGGAARCRSNAAVSHKHCRSKIGSRHSPRTRERRHRFFHLGQRKTSCSARPVRPILRHTSTIGPVRPDFSRRSSVQKDYQESVEKLRKDAAEAALIRDLTTDGAKREVFNPLYEHLNRLADEVEPASKVPGRLPGFSFPEPERLG